MQTAQDDAPAVRYRAAVMLTIGLLLVAPLQAARATGLILEQAALMAPGEWRNLAHLTTWPGKDEGVSFKSFQYVGPINGGSGGADGMGWTQQLVEHDGKLMMVLSRSQFERALMVMEADGRFWRINQPEGFDSNAGHPGGRRPFNRLTQDEDYLYFAPSDSPRTEMGWLIRTPLDSPGVFERVGPPFRDTQVDGVGSFAITYVKEWGRFYAYTPGGKIWSRAPEETEWHLHERLPRNDDGRRLSGYAGLLLWNSVKRELAIVGGQNFGSSPRTSYMQYRLTEPFGAPELMADRVGPDGERMLWGSGSSKLIVDPRDGGYLFLKSNVLYRAPDLASPYTVYEDLTGSLPFGRYEPYCPFALIPGTDVIAFISHIRGLVLHRLKPLVAEAPARKPGDDAVQSENRVTGQPMPQPAPDLLAAPGLAQSAIGQLAASTQPGVVAEIPGAAFPPGHADFRTWFTQASRADTWGDRIHWHPETASIYFQGLNARNVFYRYDALTNSWSDLPLEGGPVKETGGYHVYNKIALDSVRGHYYRLWRRSSRQNALLRYVIAERRWETLADPMLIVPLSASDERSFIPIEWHDDLDRLIVIRQRRAWAIDPERADSQEGYTDLGPVGVHGYHSTAHYNSNRREMLVMGGNHSSRTVSVIGPNGAITEAASLPFNHRITNDNLTHDPVSGAYLVYRASTGELWELSGDLSNWTLVRTFDEGVWRSRYAGLRLAPIPELGVIFIQTEHGARIYKHASNNTDAAVARRTPPRSSPPSSARQLEDPPPAARASPASQPNEAPSGIHPAPAANARDLSPAMIRAIRSR